LKEYRNNEKKNGQELRTVFIEGKIKDYEEEGDTKLADHYRHLLLHERNREMNRRISNKLVAERGFLDSLHGVDLTGRYIIAETKSAMEEVARVENNFRFTQANNTPFFTEPLLRDIGPLADLEGAAQILNGSYAIPDQLDIGTKALIRTLSVPIPNHDLGPINWGNQ